MIDSMYIYVYTFKISRPTYMEAVVAQWHKRVTVNATGGEFDPH